MMIKKRKMKKNKIIIYGTLLIALLLQVLFLVAYKNNSFFFYHPVGDSVEYIKMAKEALHISFLGTKLYYYSSVLYIYIIALAMLMFKNFLLFLRLFQMAVGVFNIYIVYLVAKKYLEDEQIALIASALSSIYGMYVVMHPKSQDIFLSRLD